MSKHDPNQSSYGVPPEERSHMSIRQRIQQKVWNALYPIFPLIERPFLPFHQKQRQKYHLGWLHPSKSLANLKNHLNTRWGFGNHFVAWEDSNQILSWRKLTSFDEQYHLRVYNDGEIRGHYEHTPESAPLKHFFEKDETARRADFERFLEGYLVHEKHARKVELVPVSPNAEPEMVFARSRVKNHD